MSAGEFASERTVFFEEFAVINAEKPFSSLTFPLRVLSTSVRNPNGSYLPHDRPL